MDMLRDLFRALMGDATPAEQSQVMKLGFRLVVGVHILWACGWLASVGFPGFAMASEVDEKIAKAVEPINKQLEEIKSKELASIKDKLAESEETQRRILAAAVSSQLRDLNRLRCSTSDAVLRTRMEQDIDEAHDEYQKLTGQRYPLPACKDL